MYMFGEKHVDLPKNYSCLLPKDCLPITTPQWNLRVTIDIATESAVKMQTLQKIKLLGRKPKDKNDVNV